MGFEHEGHAVANTLEEVPPSNAAIDYHPRTKSVLRRRLVQTLSLIWHPRAVLERNTHRSIRLTSERRFLYSTSRDLATRHAADYLVT